MTSSVQPSQTAYIPHIFHVIPSFSHGGVPIRISYLMNYFGPRARHTLLSTDKNYACETRLNEQVNYVIPEIGEANKGNILQRIGQYRKILKHIKPDLLLTYNWGSTEWALANSIKPVCRHIHLESGFGPEESRHTMPRRNWFRRLALRNIEAIVVPSKSLMAIGKTDWKIPDHKIRYIPNGVDCEKYASEPQKGIIPNFSAIENNREHSVIIGTMTPLRPEKNLPRLITAFRNMLESCRKKKPDLNFKLVIMGEGNEREKLENMISDYDLADSIYLAGHIDDPARALGWLDIYAISSDTEQMPNSLNQAMAAGLAIVGLDVGDVKFMLHEKNKPFIVPAGDDDAFSRAMGELATNMAIRKKLAQINKTHVKENFDQQDMFDAYADIWGLSQ